jgi:biopolymer transport protein ExbD/biopolymer transport protein TolR
MARRRRTDRMAMNAEINVVSLIDVMMLLMVIFMITAPIMQGGVDVALPKGEAKPLEAKSGMVVTVDHDGTIFVDNDRLSVEEFRAAFKALASRHGKDGVYLRADKDVPYGVIAQVLAIMRSGDQDNVGLVIEPADQGQ